MMRSASLSTSIFLMAEPFRVLMVFTLRPVCRAISLICMPRANRRTTSYSRLLSITMRRRPPAEASCMSASRSACAMAASMYCSPRSTARRISDSFESAGVDLLRKPATPIEIRRRTRMMSSCMVSMRIFRCGKSCRRRSVIWMPSCARVSPNS